MTSSDKSLRPRRRRALLLDLTNVIPLKRHRFDDAIYEPLPTTLR